MNLKKLTKSILAVLVPTMLGFTPLSHAEDMANSNDDDILDLVMPVILAAKQNVNNSSVSLQKLGTVNKVSTSELDHILVAHYTDAFTLPKTKTECSHQHEVTPAIKLCNKWSTNPASFGKCTGTYIATAATYACDTWVSYKSVMNCDWYINAPVADSMRFTVNKAQTKYNSVISTFVKNVQKELQLAVQSALTKSAVAAAIVAFPTGDAAAPGIFVLGFNLEIPIEIAEAVIKIKDWVDRYNRNKTLQDAQIGFIDSAFPVLTSDNLKQSCGWSAWKRI